MPKVSVIIPSYNHERFVKECIESVLNQTFQDFEIIITDDASRDHTVEIIRSFRDPRIKLFVQDRNRGVSVAANNCIRHSNGQYIAWLSSDDAWLPQALELEVSYLDQHPEIGAVFGKVRWVNEYGQSITDPSFHYLHVFDVENRGRFEWLHHFFYNGNCLNIPSSLVRRECFDKIGFFDPSLANLPDFDLWVRLCFKYEIHILEQALIKSRRVGEDSNASGNNPTTRRRTRLEYKTLLDHYLNFQTTKELLMAFPEATKYGRGTDDLLPYFVARTAIDTRIEFMQLWGLEVLYRFLRDEKIARKVEEQCGFTHRDLIALTGSADTFNLTSFEEIYGPGRRPRLLFYARDLLTKTIPPGSPRERAVRLADRAARLWRSEGTLALVRSVIQRLAQPLHYWIWRLKNEPRGRELLQQRALSEAFQYCPLISVIMPVYNVDLNWLKAAVASVESQTYRNWELCIADDASSTSDIRPYLEQISAQNPRIKVTFRNENGHISRASNSAIELATGEFLCTLDNDDVLYPQALFKLVERLNEYRELDIIYSDSDLIVNNHRRKPAFKPNWSPDLFYSNNYLNHLTLLRKSLVDKVGGFRPGFEGSQDYDLYLRVLAVADSARIAHIPEVLYGWRSIPGSAAADPSNKDYAAEAGQRALSSTLNAGQMKADIGPGIINNTFHTRYLIRDNPLVSVIISGNKLDSNGNACLDSFYENAGYANCEVIVVGEPLSEPPQQHPIRFIKCEPQPSQANTVNHVVGQATGQFVLFLDDKVRLLTPDSLSYLLADAQRKDIGIVGPKIICRNEIIYSAGIVLGRANAELAHVFQGRLDVADRYAANTIRNYLALSDLCFLVAKAKFEAVGGYDETFGLGLLSHLDFCLKLHNSGHRHLYTPFVTVYNQAPAEESIDRSGAERFRAKWLKYLEHDPYYSPNYSRKRADFTI